MVVQTRNYHRAKRIICMIEGDSASILLSPKGDKRSYYRERKYLLMTKQRFCKNSYKLVTRKEYR